MLTATLNSLVLAATLGNAPIDINQLDGQTTSGTLVSLSPDQMVVETDDGTQTFTTREIFSLTFVDSYGDEDFIPLEDPLVVQFVDGSSLQATGFQVEAGRATVLRPEDDPIRAATRSVHSVRFFKPTVELSKQWDDIETASDVAGDVLVIRKTLTVEDENGIEQESIGLDSLEGVLYDITDESVAFEFDGTRVDVPRHKVEGVIYFRRTGARLAEPTSRVSTVDGTIWNLKSCQLDGDTLKGVSVGGVRLSMPLASLTKLDFSVGNLVFLSDLEPSTFHWKADFQTSKTPSVVPTWYHLRLDEGFYGGPLRLDSRSYEKGLSLHSQTKLSYRLTRDFDRFAAIAGIDDRFQADGNVTLTISGDGKQLLSEDLAGSRNIEINLDLRGIRRLEILVDYGDDEVGYGDYLNLCNARLMK
ncbi:MAG: NPCBM/NEW2 domain-containing protein [Planctomycetes bacterium]|nr:NPCBM/NEW2 domain-containing protein [Planctomycetota bacterium]